ncbi:ribosome maturation factor RimM [Asticcacaulis endophyticus]|uniref:Ribosome maturation factor RimM n=1 Tax=Asticcacaulis endophyticus TaxID=1395890 RepID=A0A918QFU4_9CAUL|nr:ribosome maturation factor RimM [Asticcacaulis endophyticus]GGZ42092.1 ribosome maturation factor RimM [Asticcacaulis endophyticus]
MTEKSDLIFVAQVAASFGVKGEFKLLSYTADPLSVLEYNPLFNDKGEPALSLTGARAHKGALVVRADGIDDKDKADKLKGLKLYVPRLAFAEPEDEDDFYITDLIGLEARNGSGEVVGRIKNVDNFGAGDLLDIQPKSGASFYLAFTRENVPEVSVTGGYVVIELPPETQAEPSDAEQP